MEKTRFGVIVSERTAEIHELPIPPLGPHDVVLENKSCNICTTDYQQWMGLRPHQPTPVAFGHENSGIVAAVGSDVINVKVGDHATIDIYGPCMECEDCRKGRNSIFCRFAAIKTVKQADRNGYYGFYGCASYQIGKSKHVHKLENDLPFEYAGFAEPLSTVIHGMKKLRVTTGDRILIIGAGTMGNLNAQMARYYGAEVTIADISEKKLETARRLGFDKILNARDADYLKKARKLSGGGGFEAIIIAVGITEAYNQALEMVAGDGRLLIFAAGYPPPSWNLEPNPVHYKLWEIIGTYGCGFTDFHRAVTLLSNRAIDVAPLIEDRISIDDIQGAFEKASTPDNFRVAVIL